MKIFDATRNRLNALRTDFSRAATYALWGGAGAFAGDLIVEPASDIIASPAPAAFNLFAVAVRIAFVGAGITAGLASCVASRGHWRSITLTSLLKPAGWGALAGAGSGLVAQMLYVSLGGSEVSRVAAWSVGGGLLGFVLSPYVPNLIRMRATAGGAIGGALGGIAFIALAYTIGETLGRFAGLAIIGASIGAMVVFADALLRTAWIEARYDGGQVETRTLGETWVVIGSDERLASIYSASSPSWGLRYRLNGGLVECEDFSSGFRGPVTPADRRRSGNVQILVCSANDNSKVSPAPHPSKTLPIPSLKPSPMPSPVPIAIGAPQRPAMNARTFTAQIRRDRAVVGSGTTSEILVQVQGVAPSHVEIVRSSGTFRVTPMGNFVVHFASSGRESDLRQITSATEMHDGAVIAFGPARATFRDAPARLEIVA